MYSNQDYNQSNAWFGSNSPNPYGSPLMNSSPGGRGGGPYFGMTSSQHEQFGDFSNPDDQNYQHSPQIRDNHYNNSFGGITSYNSNPKPWGAVPSSLPSGAYSTFPERRNQALYTDFVSPTHQSPQYTPSSTMQRPAQPGIPQQMMTPQRYQPSRPKLHFVHKLQDTRVKEGETVILSGLVQGGDPPKVKCYLEGKHFVPDDRRRLEMDETGRVVLRIYNSNVKDAGFYTIRVSNSTGWDACSALVSVETHGEVDDTSFVSKETLKQLNFLRRDRSKRHGDDDTGVEEKIVKPVFRKRPADVDAQEGTVVRLNCLVGGRPPPEVNWLKDGLRVFDDPTHKLVVNEGGMHSLIFTNVQVFDAATYTCMAHNKAGEATCQVHLTVKQKAFSMMPKFLEKIQTVNARTGETAVFKTTFDGAPRPMISWQKDGRIVHGDGFRVRIDTDGAHTMLTINNVEREDAAWYQCTASNTGGSASTRAKLTVDAGQPIHNANTFQLQKNFVIQKSPRKGPLPVSAPEQPPSWVHRARREETPESDLYSPYNPQPPIFKQALSAHPSPPLEQNQPVKLSTKVVPVGDPTMYVTWVKDSVPVQESTRVRANFDRGYASLDFDYFTSADRGVYFCVVQNSHGYQESNRVNLQSTASNASTITLFCSTSGAVNQQQMAQFPGHHQEQQQPIQQHHQQQASRPTIQQAPAPVNITDGETARFVARVGGQPTPQVTWFLNGQQLTMGSRVQTQFDGFSYTLEIMRCTAEDSGRVELAAHNQYGLDRAQTQLNVNTRRPEWQDDVKPFQPKPHMKKVLPKQGAPVLLSHLQSLNVKEGQRVKFEVHFEGDPVPKVLWFRNNAQLEETPDFQITNTDKSSSFEIPEAFLEDSGNFTVRVQNKFGSVNSSAVLQVHPGSQSQMSARGGQTQENKVQTPPKFVSSLPAVTEIAEGKELVLEVRVDADPAANGTWIKDGENIHNNPDYKITSEINCFKLMIPEVFTVDAGEYRIEVKNNLGAIQAITRVDVKETKRSTSAPMEEETKPPSIDKRFPPQIKAKLGENVRIESQVSGIPTPKVVWFLDNRPIDASSKYSFSCDANPFLQINDFQATDAGEYILRAENDTGVTTCKSNVYLLQEEKAPETTKADAPSKSQEQPKTESQSKVEEPKKEDKPKQEEAPKEQAKKEDEVKLELISGLSESLTKKEGETLSLQCKVKGSKLKSAVWTLSGKELKKDDRISTSFDNSSGQCQLNIKSLKKEDAGSYVCSVTDESGGKVETKTNLTVDKALSEQEKEKSKDDVTDKSKEQTKDSPKESANETPKDKSKEESKNTNEANKEESKVDSAVSDSKKNDPKSSKSPAEKVELKKTDPKKVDLKNPGLKKVEPKKNQPDFKKVELKKPELKKVDPKQPAPEKKEEKEKEVEKPEPTPEEKSEPDNSSQAELDAAEDFEIELSDEEEK